MAVSAGARTLVGVKILLAGSLVAASLALSPSAVHAADAKPGETTACVTMHEFDAIQIGMRREEAERILDGRGRPATTRDYTRATERDYRICGRGWNSGRLVVLYTGKHTLRLYNAIWLKATDGEPLGI